jgi:hypothetical protein
VKHGVGLALLALLLAATGAAADPAVTAVSAASVKVIAGTRASVTLTGTDLDQVQTAGVLKGTTPAAGVTAELAPAAGKTSRVVTIVTQATAAPGRDYKLSLNGGKQTIVPALVIEIAAAPTAAAPDAKPVTTAPVVSKPAPTPEPKTTAPPDTTAKAPAPAVPAPAAPTALTVPTPAPTIAQTPAPTLAPQVKIATPPAETPAPPPTVAAAPAKPTTAIVETAAPTLAPQVKIATPPAETPAPAAPAAKALVPSAVATTTARVQVPTAVLVVAPKVSAVVPASLQLDPGANVTVALYGQSLDRLQSISVAPVRPGTAAVTAALGAAAPTLRTLTLTAGSTAPAGRYQLTALAGTTSFLLNAAVDVTARPVTPPVLVRVEPTSGGYALVGRNFGSDPARVVVYEGGSRVSTFAVTLTADRISVRSTPTGLVQHRVEVGGASSGSLSFTHPGPTIGSVGVTSAELARILASPKAAGVMSPTAALSAPLATAAGATRSSGASTSPTAGGVGAATPSGSFGTFASGPSTPAGASAAASRAQAAPARGGQAVAPRTATTPELTMTGLGLGPMPGVGQ